MRPTRFPRRCVLVPDLEYAVSGGEIPDEHPSPLGEHRVLGGCLEQTRTTRPDSKLVDPVESPTYMCNDAWHDLVSTVDIVRPQAIPGPYLLDRPLRAVGQQDWRLGWMAKPITSGRRNAEDLRSRTVVRH